MTESKGPPSPLHIETVSGRYVVPWNLDHEQVCIEDIAFALSNGGRFTGHVRTTVAAHSVLVSRLMEGMGACVRGQYAGLMHDAHEAYLNDMNKPTCRQPEMAPYCAAKDRAQVAIIKALPGPGPCRGCEGCVAGGLLKTFDGVSCLIEAYFGLPSKGHAWSIATPEVVRLRDITMHALEGIGRRLADGTMSRRESEMWFTERYEELCEHGEEQVSG